MSRVAIVTICDNSNYGNRLQNYALHKTLNNLGISNVTLWDRSKNTFKERVKINIKKILPSNNIGRKKYLKFNEFTSKNISNLYVDMDNLKELRNEFDYFIVGSDQIWNYNFGHATEKDFLNFVQYDKRISYAPSFGVSKIDSEHRYKITEGINNIKYLSVREQQGATIIKELTNREAKVVLDPTLLISKNEWMLMEKRPKKMINKKYILTYFLGEISKELNDEINKISKENNLEIINLNNIEYKDFYVCGPSEFLYLFSNAEIVLTDSFHACVFSMIYDKPFYVFDRNTEGMKCMNSRLDTLLKTFKQEERKVSSLENIDNVFLCDYSESYKILREKQIESLEFLQNALNISEYSGEVING